MAAMVRSLAHDVHNAVGKTGTAEPERAELCRRIAALKHEVAGLPRSALHQWLENLEQCVVDRPSPGR